MSQKISVKSSSQIKKNQTFSLKLFKKPFCYKESKKKYKVYEYPNFKDKDFWKNKKKNTKPILVVSGPARNGNHLMMSLLDGHSSIINHPGEDDFLRSFFSYINLNEYKTISKIKNWDLKFILKLSGQPNFNIKSPKGFDKWKELYKLYKTKSKSKIWSGNQPENQGHVQDYQDLVPRINYSKFHNSLKYFKNLDKDRNFFDFFYKYLDATKELASYKAKNRPYKFEYRISGSGLRREMFYLMSELKTIKLICPIRKFEGFYYSYAKTRHKLDRKFNQKALDDMWEHWRHKVIDYLILKHKYPKNVALVRFEDLTNHTKITMKKLSKFLGVRYEKSLLEPTVFGKKSLGNSSFQKKKNLKGKIYQTKDIFPINITLPREYRDIQKILSKKVI